MAGKTDQPQSQSGTTPGPDLIERYRMRRDAWIAQADELARLRDEVRGSAEREAMEIVTAARRDVRKVIMEARRELLVLSAQVQAALGEATQKTDPATLLNKAGITQDPDSQVLLPSAVEAFAPEDAVNEILNEVQDDITALAEDARALPLQAVPQVRQIAPPPSPPEPTVFAAPPPPPPATATASITTPKAETLFQEPIEIPELNQLPELNQIPELNQLPELNEISELRESASTALLSSQFPSDAVPVQSGRRLGTFVGAFVGIGVIVAGLTVWWLSNRNSTTSSSTAAAEKAAPSAPVLPTAPSLQPGIDKASPANTAGLSIIAEAVRDVWVRTTIDGRADGGRTLSAGQVIDVSAEKSISLRAGDGGAILFSLNHGEKQPLGRSGQPVTRDFGAAKADVPEPAPAVPAPQPPKPAPATPTNARTAPPIASATPAPAPPIPQPAQSAPVAVAQRPNPPAPVIPPPAPTVAPAPPANQVANNTQPAVPPGVVNQLSAPANSSAPAAVSPANVVLAIARQWLDAYHRQDRAAMAALSTENLLLADERRPEERFPPGLSDVTRALDRVSVQIAADTAVLTAVMTEQSGSQPSPHVSPISQVWVLGAGQWKVRQARFVSEARLNQVFR
jgi:outer membrane biosynthesis protein TonB